MKGIEKNEEETSPRRTKESEQPILPSKLGWSRIRERTGVCIMTSWERSKDREEGNETQNHCLGPSASRGKIEGCNS